MHSDLPLKSFVKTSGMDLLPRELHKHIPAVEPKPPTNGYLLRISQPYVSSQSKEKVIQAIEENKISSGSSLVIEFETKLKDFYSVPFAKACSSGYSALVLALKYAGIGKGDDVIIPSFTFVAVVNAVFTVEANPIFADCEDGELNPSCTKYEDKITSSTKAIIVAHTYGVPADCLALTTLCKSRGILLIEDIAEAIGTRYNGKLVGTFGDFACSSLYANKVITAGDGGFVISKKEQDPLITYSYANHGMLQNIRYFHLECCGNYKMAGLLAAFITPAVDEIPLVMEDRRRISITYRKHLHIIPGITLQPVNTFGIDAPWLIGVLAKSKQHRTAYRKDLAKDGIETRDFFFPLHLQPSVIGKIGLTKESLPNAVHLATCGLSLPTYYGLRGEEIEFICDCLKKSIKLHENNCIV